MQIKNTTALVTGGASGLGAATVRALHAAGGNVAIVDLQEEKGQALAKELGDRAIFAKADVSSDADMQAAVKAALAKFGGLNHAICCAGIGWAQRIIGKEGPMPMKPFEKVIQVNLIGSFNTVRLCANEIAKGQPNSEGERGCVVMTASVAAFDGQIGQCAYSASKGGIVGMTLPIARDLSSMGIRVNTIAPGLFDTPLMAFLPEEARLSLGRQVPFPPRLGRPPEYAQLVVSIIENAMLNGETIRLDGAIRMAPR
jgi:NAD(P)-dependent dehydrogenase (short-subunit alcohol dehydrogenase family)